MQPLPRGPRPAANDFAGAPAASGPAPTLGAPDRRLTRFELAYAVRDLFGFDATVLHALPPPRASIGDVPDVLVGRQLDRSDEFRLPYRRMVHELASTIAGWMHARCDFSRAASVDEVGGRRLDDEGALECLRARLAEPAARAWRTLDRGALAELEAAARPQAERGARTMLQVAIERLLDDERFFVLQLEPREPSDAAFARRRLASHLALVLWSSVPDLPLLQRAASGALDDDAGLQAEIARMMADPRFERWPRELARQWLRLDRPTQFRPSLAARTLVSEPKRLDHAVEEAGHILRENLQQRAPVDKLLTPRGGLLTSTALLGAISTEIRGGGDETWLGRGLVVQSAFLCRTFPLAAIYPLRLWQNHPLLNPHVVATTTRPGEPALLAIRTKDAPCAGCHRQLETIGAALWMYDGLGRATPHAPHIPAQVAGQPVDGPDALGRWILGTGRFESCAAEKLLTYVLGRAVLPSKRAADRQVVDELAAAPKGQRSLGAWLRRTLQSQAFRQPGPATVRDTPTPLATSNAYVDPLPPAPVSDAACAGFSPGRFLVDACGSSACHGPGAPTGAFAVADAAKAVELLRAIEPRPDGYCADERGLIDVARPAESLLIRKVTAGGRACGAPMPIVNGGPRSLDPIEHACFVRWVESVAH